MKTNKKKYLDALLTLISWYSMSNRVYAANLAKRLVAKDAIFEVISTKALGVDALSCMLKFDNTELRRRFCCFLYTSLEPLPKQYFTKKRKPYQEEMLNLMIRSASIRAERINYVY